MAGTGARPIVEAAARLTPPPAPEHRPGETFAHGHRLVDEFAWLRAPDWQEVLRTPASLPEDIRAFLERENEYCAALMAPFELLRKDLVREMRARIREDDSSPPAPDGGFVYYTRYREGGQHPLLCRRPRTGGEETLMIDADALGAGRAFFDLGGHVHSPDHRLLAWSVDDKGSEYFTLRVRDIAGGQDLADTLEETEGDVVWLADSSGFYYVRLDENHRPSRVFRHRLGEAQAQDECIFEEHDPGWFVSVRQTQSGRFGVIALRDHDSAEAHLLDLADLHARPRLVEARAPGLRYDVEHHENRLIIRTNADGAEDFKIVEAPLAAPARANWRDLVPHSKGRMIITGLCLRHHMIRLERSRALPTIIITRFSDGEEHEIAFEEEAYALGFGAMLEYETRTIRFIYSSMTTPAETFDYDVETRARVLVKRQEIPSGHDPAGYVTERIFVKVDDGTHVPATLLYRKGMKRDGTAPVLLYGYGSYGHSIPASFATGRLSLVDRGFIYCIAHVRGGTDMGWHWYADGKLDKKPNTFSDFLAVARYLADNAYTGEGRIVAQGGSAGGMLMGAIANMAPALFAGIIADVPFVDVINTMMDKDLPLTPPEWLEWGNPIEDEAAFRTMLSYSPYDNVSAQDYPPILALAGLTDPRVTYWEPAKWVARLRTRMTGGGPVMLKTNMDAGHAGASGRFERLDEVGLEYAFALACVEKTQADA